MICHRRTFVFAAAVCLAAAGLVLCSDEPKLTEEQMKEFLLTAKVVGSKQLGQGKTHPWRLTLTDGTLTHDAAFQPVDERKPFVKFGSGRTEMNFVDSYHYNIAAYELAKLIGLGDMVPVAVERKWNGQRGALAWWIPKKWDEEQRRKANAPPPDLIAWNNQMYKVRVFSQLVYDTDRNLGNLLITEDWKLWMIDFTRAFRLYDKLETPGDLQRCDRQLLEKLRQLDGKELYEKARPHLTKSEVKAVLTRRDKIVALFQQLVAEKGEGAVLY